MAADMHGCPCAEAGNVQNILQVEIVQAWHSAKTLWSLSQDIQVLHESMQNVFPDLKQLSQWAADCSCNLCMTKSSAASNNFCIKIDPVDSSTTPYQVSGSFEACTTGVTEESAPVTLTVVLWLQLHLRGSWCIWVDWQNHRAFPEQRHKQFLLGCLHIHIRQFLTALAWSNSGLMVLLCRNLVSAQEQTAAAAVTWYKGGWVVAAMRELKLQFTNCPATLEMHA